MLHSFFARLARACVSRRNNRQFFSQRDHPRVFSIRVLLQSEERRGGGEMRGDSSLWTNLYGNSNGVREGNEAYSRFKKRSWSGKIISFYREIFQWYYEMTLVVYASLEKKLGASSIQKCNIGWYLARKYACVFFESETSNLSTVRGIRELTISFATTR